VLSVILLNVVGVKADMRGVILLSAIVLNVAAPFAGTNNSSPAKTIFTLDFNFSFFVVFIKTKVFGSSISSFGWDGSP
jgi:hypothetical protein